MWYRLAINLPDWKFSPVETSLSVPRDDVKSITENLVSDIDLKKERLDEIYHFAGMDPHSKKFQNISHTILQVSHSLVPLLSSIIEFFEKEGILKFFIKKQYGLMGIIGDMHNLINICRQLEHIEDPVLRVRKFSDYFRASGGMHGILSGLFAVFNSVSKFLKFLAHIDVHSPIDFSTVFMGISIAEYLIEESRDDEHKSGVNLVKTRVVNPHVDFLVKKNPKNRVVVNYVRKYIKQHPDKSHEEVRDHALKYFLRGSKSKFRDIGGSNYYYMDIVDIVDNLYEDPHDQISFLRGKRINKQYYDEFMKFLGDSSAIQMKINKAAFDISKLLVMLPHI